VFRDVSELASLPAGTFVEPIVSNWSCADAVITPNVLLSPTAGPVHPIRLRAIQDFQQYMRGSQQRLSLIFVVPPNMFPTFKLQPLLTSECLHVSDDPQAVDSAQSTQAAALDSDEESCSEQEEETEVRHMHAGAAVGMRVDSGDVVAESKGASWLAPPADCNRPFAGMGLHQVLRSCWSHCS